MTDDLQDEFVRNTVRAHLRARNVKLWIHPYVNEQGGPNINILESLAEEYFQQLNLDKKDCLYMLTTLQDNALMRLREQEQFSSGGVATLYIRYSGFSVHHSGSSVDPLPSTSMTNYIQDTKSQAQLEISVNATGKDLIDAISQLSGKSPEQIKLVFSGRIIDKDKNLLTQGVKSSSRILAIALTPSDQIKEFEEDQAHEKFCEKTRSAAQILSKENNEFSSFQLEGQTGHALKLDRREKEAICLALAFHERGRAKLKRGDHSFALLLFLEADKEFERCDSDLLKSVDNVALLQLDIVWCYLCLRSMSHIPDADRRLNQCEIILERSYGKNLERVEALKDSAGIKGALLMRLHLLQAIVAFHLHKIVLSKELLRKAENELESLLVNTDDIAKIAALGYSTSEALLGLRACQGNLDAAVSKICEWQEERKRAREQNRKDEEKERERARLGRTADGSRYIEPDCVQTLCGMGYDRDLAICALKHSNNSMSQAVHLLQEQRHLLDVKRKCVKISDEEVTQIAAMGFDVDISRHALRKHNGCVEEAINDLVNNGGIISLEQDQLLPEEYDHNINNPPASSSASLNEKSRKAEEDRKTEKRKQMEASKELENDISDEQYDYLSLTLEEEKKFLIEYKTLLNL